MAAEREVNPEPKFEMKHTLKFLIIDTLLLGSHLQATEPHRYDLTKRASEIDPQAREHPEIKFTFIDDKGKPADLQHAVVDTRVPSQGKLATSGVRFTDAYANGSFCTPTRAALMSCRYQHRYGIEDLAGPLPAQANTLPQRLRGAGYTTGMVGKWHLGSEGDFTPVDRGFDEFFGFAGGGHQYIVQSCGKFVSPRVVGAEGDE
jgi:arylsulfatase A-like enzyme